MAYDFNRCPDRRGSASLKWEKYRDRDILPFWVADMDFRTAPEIIAELQDRLDHGVFGYTVPPREAVDAVVAYHARQHGWNIDPAWIVWFPGLVPALHLIARAFSEPGETVVTTTPVYPPFLAAPNQVGRALASAGHVVGPDGRWQVDFDALDAAVLPQARLFYLCSPQNPTGRSYGHAELARHIELCRRHDLLLVSDEIHCDLILDPGTRHRPAATVDPDYLSHTVSLYAPSKTWNLAGLACSYALVPDAARRARLQRSIRGTITEINCFGYTGLTAAYNYGEPWRQELLAILRTNRDRLLGWLAEHAPGLMLAQPIEATYLAWIDCRPLAAHFPAVSAEDPASFFETHGLGLSDGRPFGAPGFVRFNYGCPPDALEEGLARMGKALASLAG